MEDNNTTQKKAATHQDMHTAACIVHAPPYKTYTQTHTPLQFLDLLSKALFLAVEEADLVLQLLDYLCLLLQ